MARIKVALSANQALLQFYGGNKFFHQFGGKILR